MAEGNLHRAIPQLLALGRRQFVHARTVFLHDQGARRLWFKDFFRNFHYLSMAPLQPDVKGIWPSIQPFTPSWKTGNSDEGFARFGPGPNAGSLDLARANSFRRKKRNGSANPLLLESRACLFAEKKSRNTGPIA